MTKVVLVVGSLREKSFNRQLADRIAERMRGHAEVSYLTYADLPLMNQDLEWPVPDAVARVRSEIIGSDGLWFVCPEYNGSYPGHVKNLIDWLSRPTDVTAAHPASTALQGKKCTISGVGGRFAASRMREKLTELLGFVGAEVMDGPCAAIALGADALGADALALTPQDHAAIGEQVDAFYAFVADKYDQPNMQDVTSVPAEPSEGGVFARSEAVGSCSDQGCSVHRGLDDDQ